MDAVLLLDQHLSLICRSHFVRSQWRIDGISGKTLIDFGELKKKNPYDCSGSIHLIKVFTYVAEVVEPRFRGMLTASGPTTVATGVLFEFIMGAFLNWRTVAWLSSILPCFTIIALCFVPESPYWLINKGRIDDARKSLARLRGWVSVDDIAIEFNAINDGFIRRKKDSDAVVIKSMAHRVLPYTKRSFVAPFTLISFTILVSNFSGLTTLQTYAVQIFKSLKSPIDEYYATIFYGMAQLTGALICVFSVRYTGKRPLAFVSLIGSGICSLITATYASIYIDSSPESKHSVDILEIGSKISNVSRSFNSVNDPIDNCEFHWLPVTFILLSAVLAHSGFRLIPWMMIGEVFPPDVRSSASGFVGGTGYFFAFLSNKIFLSMIAIMTLPGTFWFNSAVSLIGCAILYFTMPETEGKTLLEIESFFRSKPTSNAKRRNSVDQEVA